MPCHRGPVSAARTRVRAAALVTCLALATSTLAACSGDEEDEPSRPSQTTAASPTATATLDDRPDAKLRIRTGKVTGRLSKKRQRVVARDVGRTVDRWFRAAWLDGPWPQRGYTRADFPGFSKGARTSALKDRRELTNAVLSKRISGVWATRREVVVDIFAPKGKPAGATARFTLVLATAGGPARRVRVTGSLDLSPRGERWQVFAYDVARQVAFPGRDKGSPKGKQGKQGNNDKNKKKQKTRKGGDR